MKWDAFISYASEDKDFVHKLAEALTQRGLKIWYDKFVLRLGDSLRRNIDQGLAGSRHGIVILSNSFFAKEWPQRELDGLFQRETESHRILPIHHDISPEQIREYSLPLADKLGIPSSQPLQLIVDEIIKAIGLGDGSVTDTPEAEVKKSKAEDMPGSQTSNQIEPHGAGSWVFNMSSKLLNFRNMIKSIAAVVGAVAALFVAVRSCSDSTKTAPVPQPSIIQNFNMGNHSTEGKSVSSGEVGLPAKEKALIDAVVVEVNKAIAQANDAKLAEEEGNSWAKKARSGKYPNAKVWHPDDHPELQYEGEWPRNRPSVYGLEYYLPPSESAGETFIGMFDGDTRKRGVFEYPNDPKYRGISRYEGEWSPTDGNRGDWSGNGRIIYRDGSIYEGQVKPGIKDGLGQLTKRNGEKIVGKWENDQQVEGESVRFDASDKLLR